LGGTYTSKGKEGKGKREVRDRKEKGWKERGGIEGEGQLASHSILGPPPCYRPT